MGHSCYDVANGGAGKDGGEVAPARRSSLVFLAPSSLHAAPPSSGRKQTLSTALLERSAGCC